MLAHSENLADLAAALVKAQAAFPNIDMDGTGQVGQNRNYRYATLAHIIKTVTPVLTANGLSVTQTCEPASGGMLRVTTTLLHASGQYLEGTLEMPAGSTAQQAGSAMTYARRYSLAGILGVAADEDDDGAEASKPRTAPRAHTAPPAPEPPPATPPTRYEAMTPATATEMARRWFFAKVKEDTGLDSKQAYALLEIKSLTEEMPDHTFEQILGFIKMAQARQAKAAMAN